MDPMRSRLQSWRCLPGNDWPWGHGHRPAAATPPHRSGHAASLAVQTSAHHEARAQLVSAVSTDPKSMRHSGFKHAASRLHGTSLVAESKPCCCDNTVNASPGGGASAAMFMQRLHSGMPINPKPDADISESKQLELPLLDDSRGDCSA